MTLQIILNTMHGRSASGKSSHLKPITSLVKHTTSIT